MKIRKKNLLVDIRLNAVKVCDWFSLDGVDEVDVIPCIMVSLGVELKSLSMAIKNVPFQVADKAEIVDVVIAQISARSSEELLTVGGKALLKEELLEEINAVINEVTEGNEEIAKDNVKKLFFTTFVIK